MKIRSNCAFSLVEMTLALGVAAFCLIAVLGLMPVGVQTNRNATSQTAATNILSSVVSDIRASPTGQGRSAIYKINRGKNNNTTLYFDGGGECSPNLNGSTRVDGTPWNPPLQTRYRLYVATDATVGGVLNPQHAWLRVSWPAAVDTINTTIKPSGSVETVTAYFVK
jgi:type II secretory pathway pseudopilin PulG